MSGHGDGPPDAAADANRNAGADASPPSVPDAPAPDYSSLDDALDESDAAGFVAVGDVRDPDVRYLARLSGPAADGPVAFVRAADGGDPVLVVPDRFDPLATDGFPGRVVAADDAGSLGRRAAAVLEARTGGGRVHVPRDVPHDAAVYLERAGFELTSTPATADARARKTEAERACLRFAAAAAERGMARAAEVLAAAATTDGELRWGDAPLTPERLRREANAAMARAGVDAADATAVEAGPPATRTRARADEPLRPGETVLVGLAPRGPHGYRGALARTFVVEGGGGWERRAHVAVTAAARAGLDAVEPGAPARRVRDEVVAELAAHGFDAGVGDADGDDDLYGSTGGGLGLSRREAPSLRGDDTLELGHVLSLAAGLADPDGGVVRVADAVAVTEDGPTSLTAFPTSLSPSS